MTKSWQRPERGIGWRKENTGKIYSEATDKSVAPPEGLGLPSRQSTNYFPIYAESDSRFDDSYDDALGSTDLSFTDWGMWTLPSMTGLQSVTTTLQSEDEQQQPSINEDMNDFRISHHCLSVAMDPSAGSQVVVERDTARRSTSNVTPQTLTKLPSNPDACLCHLGGLDSIIPPAESRVQEEHPGRGQPIEPSGVNGSHSLRPNFPFLHTDKRSNNDFMLQAGNETMKNLNSIKSSPREANQNLLGRNARICHASAPAKPVPNHGLAGLERVLEVIEEAGFDGVDSMTTAYYTTRFPPGSSLHSAQATSRRRHLKRLLNALHESAKSWDPQEAQSFREGIMRNAEDIVIKEMHSLDLNHITSIRSDGVFGLIDSALASEDSHCALKENKRVFKEQERTGSINVPEHLS
ncbi:hypothetical protein O1611_g3380 [Lasiodiplodia mahajangana]|uniref:Uncharacterized protein n=1 Tax=Lasiodiplodia mahajangana TaxID=1108764 RepID=A0ACC2JRY5_9PEZI|nr:hypothetical protein O1611_g3380 [Lasiodiplodia mahajangana]